MTFTNLKLNDVSLAATEQMRLADGFNLSASNLEPERAEPSAGKGENSLQRAEGENSLQRAAGQNGLQQGAGKTSLEPSAGKTAASVNLKADTLSLAGLNGHTRRPVQ